MQFFRVDQFAAGDAGRLACDSTGFFERHDDGTVRQRFRQPRLCERVWSAEEMALSPDGHSMLYTPRLGTGCLMLWALDDASHGPVGIKCPAPGATFNWDPQGDRIAVAVRCTAVDSTQTVDDGPVMELLRAGESAPRGIRVRGVCGRPSWSPDGRRIAMVRPVAAAAPEIVVVDAVTGSVVPIAHGRSPAWSPSGKWIGYVALAGEETDEPMREQEVRRIRSDGRRDERIRSVSRTLAGDSGPISARVDRLVWAPDGRTIALDVGKEIWIVSATDSTAKPIVVR